jgi:pyruvate dehydrogenase E1 component alpha subunit
MTREEAFGMYRQMLLIRRFEERAAQLYVEGKIGGFLHLYIGQEAVGVGAMSLLRPDDYFITSYRDHGYALARGTDPRPLMAELCGKAGGISRGKGGSMHFYDVPRGNFGGDGIVGGHLPVAAGMGYAIRLRGSDQVVLCFFGDGAVNEGAFHEALNVSALWDLPVVYVIENNRYGMGTSLDRASSVKDLYQRASAYGMPRRDVNGMDLMAVRTVLAEAIDRARGEKRPTLIEAETYRYRGHSMSDPGKYRTKEEVEEMMRYDPIYQFGKRLIEQERFTQAELDAADQEILAQVEESVRFSDESPLPSAESLFEDVYVRSPYLHLKAAEKDPAWGAAARDDRVPEQLPAADPAAKVGG